MVGVQVEGAHALAGGAGHFDKVVAPSDACAGFFQFGGKGGVALDGVFAQAGDAHGRAAEQSGGKEIGGARCVAFDGDAFGGAVACGGDEEAAVGAVFDGDAEALHQVEGDVDIGLGNQFAFDADFAGFAGERQCH